MPYTEVDALFTGIADAIRSIDGTVDPIPTQDMPTKISGITSMATAEESDILAPKTAYIATGKVTGTCTYDADTSSGDAVAADIAQGKKAFVQGEEVVGTLIDSLPALKSVIDDSSITVLNIPPGTTKIMPSKFLNHVNLTSVVFPDADVVIGSSAFSGCAYLENLALPASLTSMFGSYAFSNCTRLNLTSLPVGLSGELPTACFNGCSALALTSLPIGITKIGHVSLRNCSSLVNLDMPGVTIITAGNPSVDATPMGSCSGLQNLTIGSAGHPVTSIISNAFYGNTQLGLTITIYVTPGTQPLDGSPWGATNATIVYRSAVDGSVL